MGSLPPCWLPSKIFERLEETLAILRDTDTLKRLTESDAELARGEEVSADELAETMHSRRKHE